MPLNNVAFAATVNDPSLVHVMALAAMLLVPVLTVTGFADGALGLKVTGMPTVLLLAGNIEAWNVDVRPTVVVELVTLLRVRVAATRVRVMGLLDATSVLPSEASKEALYVTIVEVA